MVIGNVPEQMVMHFQVANMKNQLMSVAGAADMGFGCVLGRTCGFLLDSKNGNRIPITRKGSAYVMELWVKDEGVAGRG